MSGYDEAVKQYERERTKEKKDALFLENKKNFLIKVLKFIITESGFELTDRIKIKDKKTGKEFV